MLSWDLIEICWIYIFFAVVEFVLGMMLFVDDGEKTQGSLKFQSRFTRPLKPFFHHSHGPQHAPSGSTRGVFLCSYFIQQGFLPPVNIFIDFMKDSFGQMILDSKILCGKTYTTKFLWSYVFVIVMVMIILFIQNLIKPKIKVYNIM